MINREVLPHEYAPLHGFLGGVAVLVLLIGTTPVCASLAERAFEKKPALLGVLTGVTVLWAGVSMALLKDSEAMSWVVWGQSSSSRFITLRLGGNSSDENEDENEPTKEDARKSTSSKSEKLTWPPSEEIAQRQTTRAQKSPPHIIVFSIDNLQADRVGVYGYKKNPTTPNIDRLSQGGFIFENAYSLYPGTRVFLSSMLTGRRLPEFSRHRMPPRYEAESLPRLLGARGYHTLVKGVFELTAYRDFDPERYGIDTNLERETAEQIRKSKTIPHIPLKKRYKKIATHLKEAAKAKKPVFLWLHLLQPHRFRGGFVASKDFPFGDDLDSQYDSAIAATDTWIVPLEELLKKHLKDEREVVWIFMSDHGAGMTRAENKREVGKNLYDDQVHVPLIISAPGYSEGKSDVLVDSAVDASATILDLAGVPVPDDFDGVSLVPLMEQTGSNAPFHDRMVPLSAGSFKGAVSQRYKYIEHSGSSSLFELARDPEERKNLADRERKKLKALKRRAAREHRRIRQAYEKGLSEKQQKSKQTPL